MRAEYPKRFTHIYSSLMIYRYEILSMASSFLKQETSDEWKIAVGESPLSLLELRHLPGLGVKKIKKLYYLMDCINFLSDLIKEDILDFNIKETVCKFFSGPRVAPKKFSRSSTRPFKNLSTYVQYAKLHFL